MREPVIAGDGRDRGFLSVKSVYDRRPGRERRDRLAPRSTVRRGDERLDLGIERLIRLRLATFAECLRAEHLLGDVFLLWQLAPRKIAPPAGRDVTTRQLSMDPVGQGEMQSMQKLQILGIDHIIRCRRARSASTGQVSSQVLHRMQISGSIRCCLRGACMMNHSTGRRGKANSNGPIGRLRSAEYLFIYTLHSSLAFAIHYSLLASSDLARIRSRRACYRSRPWAARSNLQICQAR